MIDNGGMSLQELLEELRRIIDNYRSTADVAAKIGGSRDLIPPQIAWPLRIDTVYGQLKLENELEVRIQAGDAWRTTSAKDLHIRNKATTRPDESVPIKTVEMDREEVCALIACVEFMRESATKAHVQMPESAQHTVDVCSQLHDRLTAVARTFEADDNYEFFERFACSLGAKNHKSKPPTHMPYRSDRAKLCHVLLSVLREYHYDLADGEMAEQLISAAISLVEMDMLERGGQP